MKVLGGIIVAVLLLSSCVPAKKYNELLEKEKLCSEELSKFKTSALTFEGEANDLRSKYSSMSKQVAQLISDTTNLGKDFRTFAAKYAKMLQINEALEINYDKLRLTGARETATLQSELIAKQRD